MKAVIIGGGNVGSALATQFVDDGLDVVLVERDPEVAERLSYELDLLAIQGNGASASALERAGVREAKLFVAATGVSELNLMACTYVRSLGDAQTIARVHDAEYISMWEEQPELFGVDHMLYPELMAADRIVRILQVPDARDVGAFADGRIQMVEFVAHSDEIVGTRLRDLGAPKESLVASIVRNGDVTIPGGDAEIQRDDRVIVIGSEAGIDRFGEQMGTYVGRLKSVSVIGATEVSEFLVESMLDAGVDVKLIEEDREQARRFAERFPRCLVLHGQATDIDFLRSERIGETDAIVSTSKSDEKNLMSSLLGKRLGAENSVVKVEDPRYVELFETMGVDAAVNPHRVTTDRILMITRGESLRSVMVLEEGKAEVMELEVTKDSDIAGHPLASAGLPLGAIVGAVLRGSDVVIPGGDFVLEPGDSVVTFAETGVASRVEAMFH